MVFALLSVNKEIIIICNTCICDTCIFSKYICDTCMDRDAS